MEKKDPFSSSSAAHPFLSPPLHKMQQKTGAYSLSLSRGEGKKWAGGEEDLFGCSPLYKFVQIQAISSFPVVYFFFVKIL